MTPPPPPRPLIPGTTSGEVLRRCGADVCLNLELDESGGKFSLCSRCRRRRYCCAVCQKGDWVLHKTECTPANAAAASTNVSSASKGSGSATNSSAASAGAAGAAGAVEAAAAVVVDGEEVILHGLVARSELNGMTAVISGKLNSESGRYSTSVSTEKDMILAIKPSNFHRLGARLEYAVADGGAGAKREGKGGGGGGGGMALV